MNKQAIAFCISVLLLTSFTFQNLTIARGAAEGEETEYYIKSTLTLMNKGSGIWNFTEREEDRIINLFMNNSWQTVYLVNTTLPVETIKTDEDGNPIAVLRFPEMLLYPGHNITYTVTYRIISKPRTIDNLNETASGSLDDIPEPVKERYPRTEGPWLLNDTELQSLAKSLAQNETNVLTIVKKFVGWIMENITYTKVHDTPLYPNETLTEKRGDCDDQAILLAALSRIVGIPAFIQIGALYMPLQVNATSEHWSGHLTIIQEQIGWHGWAMIYIPPWGWLPADLTYIMGGVEDPLDAIKKAAVTWRGTIQYMNISRTDYVAISRETKNFLQTNEFYIVLKEKMIEVKRSESLFGGEIGKPISAALLILIVILLMVSSYQISKRWMKKPPKKNEVDKRILNKEIHGFSMPTNITFRRAHD
jgi:transglutaminase-like putative cysteine protease